VSVDPTLRDPLLRWLAYAHPVWMVAALALCLAALRAGLALRRARLSRRPPPRGARRAHLRLAKPAVVALLVGFAGGPASALWLRGWTPVSSLHGVLGVVAAALFAATAVLGRRLEHGRRAARAAHARTAALAVLAGLVAAAAGFALLP
jgi:Protein of unknown function (DUF4079)/Eukaryotic cytochrome b561